MPTTPSLGWAPLATGIASVGVRNSEPPWGHPLRFAARRLNTAACVGRVVFSQHVPLANNPGGAPPPPYGAAGVTDFLRFRYYNRNRNGKRLVYWFLSAGQDATATTNAAILRETAEDLYTSRYFDPSPSSTEPGDIIGTADEAVQAVTYTGAEQDKLIRLVDGMRLVSLTVFERPADVWPFELSGTDHHVDESQIAAGIPIVSRELQDMRETEDELWTRVRDCYAYSSHGFTASDGYSLTNVTTHTNLIDQTLTARSTSSPGIPISCLSGGKGFGATVNAHCAVYAERTGDAGSKGEVRFTSSLNSVTIGDITTAGWYPSASNTLQLDTTTSVDGSRDWEKVDVLGRVTTAVGGPNVLRVWAWHVEIEP